MPHCHDMKEGQVYGCEHCGLALKVVQGCDSCCGDDHDHDDNCCKMTCCGHDLVLKC